MATQTLRRKPNINAQDAVRERIFVDIPLSDKVFFKHFADKMGWQINGIGHPKKSASEVRIEELKEAILEAKAMGEDIRKNGIKGYKTLDELLAE
ncbi:MAG: hypothetical protein LBT42_00185 [Tannerella sp.]|jgi:hypothetical protein|nr:hypothetical protein [Tannerella sp.]